jgi:hypothetical protein
VRRSTVLAQYGGPRLPERDTVSEIIAAAEGLICAVEGLGEMTCSKCDETCCAPAEDLADEMDKVRDALLTHDRLTLAKQRARDSHERFRQLARPIAEPKMAPPRVDQPTIDADFCLNPFAHLLTARHEGEARGSATVLANWLGSTRPRHDIGRLIERHQAELEKYGPIYSGTTGKNPTSDLWLNEGQMICVALLSETERAAAVQEVVLKVVSNAMAGKVELTSDGQEALEQLRALCSEVGALGRSQTIAGALRCHWGPTKGKA